MALRGVLHKNHTASFMEFMTKKGYVLSAKSKNPFESFRMVNPKLNGPMRTVIIYERMELKEHFSVQDKDVDLVMQFLREVKDENTD